MRKDFSAMYEPLMEGFERLGRIGREARVYAGAL